MIIQSRFVFVCRSNVLYVENIFICWFLCEIYDNFCIMIFILYTIIHITIQKKSEFPSHYTLQDGVNWLAFLNKYNLHGILCDDMGLGKTLQSICIMASDHKLRDQKYQVSTVIIKFLYLLQ